MPTARSGVRALVRVAVLPVIASFPAGGPGDARAADDSGGGRSVFAPSPPPAVQKADEEPPLVDLNVTGRGADAYPRIDGAVSLEVQNIYNAKSGDHDLEINDLTTSNDLFTAVRLTPELSVQASVVVEDVKDPKPGQNRYFDDTGLFVETLGIVYDSGVVAVFGGKFNPTFGVAWDVTPGIFGADLADDYELTERIGFGGALTLGDDDIGQHTLTAQTFYLDTSVLSQSWGTQRGRTRESDGGVGNTETFQSFSVTLDGEVPQTIEGLRYQVGLQRQQRGRSEPDDEWGVAAALYSDFEFADEVDLEPVLEWARLKNLDGEPNTVNYLTIGGGLYVDAWNIALSYTGRFVNPESGESFTDRLFQVSAGYEFDCGFSVNIGYAFFEDENISNNVIGLLFLYDFDFRVR